MPARLIVLTDSAEMETAFLKTRDGEMFLCGRDVECDLQVNNLAVSRRHFHISCNDGKDFWLSDLDSHNGTFVNGLPVKTQLLVNRDRIAIGNTQIMFLTEEESLAIQQVKLDNDSLTSRDPLIVSQLETAEFSADLNILARFGKALNEIREAHLLQSRFLQIILEFIPAERGAILIIGSEIDDLKSVCVFADEVLDDKEMQVSRTVCQQVLSEQVALISNDLSDSNLNTAESLTTSHISSLLCVPLKIGERRGLIYLDSSNLSFRFNKDQLEQMIALSYLISAALTNAESIAQLNRENELLRASMDIETNIIGESEPIRELFYLISRAAPSDSTILIQGESGTGKELVAKTIHQNSLRKQKSYIAINCAVLSESLLESELFGHEKGAFTGAVAYKKGKLEAAEGGTLFLDEVGELAPNIQAKLLRVLQEREFERVGGTRVIKANVRVIAATNRDLEEEVKKGNFRRDLFFRLNVIRIKAPPLRERQSDIPLLIRHFMKKYNEKCNKKISGVSESARKALIRYEWNGNVRELENVIERAIVLGSTDTILLEELPDEIIRSETDDEKNTSGLYEMIRTTKQKIINEALFDAKGNYTEAAQALGIHPNNLHRLIRNLGLKI